MGMTNEIDENIFLNTPFSKLAFGP